MAATEHALIPERDRRIAEEQERQAVAALADAVQAFECLLVSVIVAAGAEVGRVL